MPLASNGFMVAMFPVGKKKTMRINVARAFPPVKRQSLAARGTGKLINLLAVAHRTQKRSSTSTENIYQFVILIKTIFLLSLVLFQNKRRY